MDGIGILADLQGTERLAINFNNFVSKVVSSTRQDQEHALPNSYAILHLSMIIFLVKLKHVPYQCMLLMFEKFP